MAPPFKSIREKLDEVILLNIFQNSFSSIKEAAPPEKTKSDLFLKKPSLAKRSRSTYMQKGKGGGRSGGREN